MTLAEAKALVIELAFERSDVEALLEASACTDEDENTVYRPYIVAAVLIRSNWQQFRSTRSASGAAVEYASPNEAYESLTSLQARHDPDCDDIPEGWRAGAAFFDVVF